MKVVRQHMYMYNPVGIVDVVEMGPEAERVNRPDMWEFDEHLAVGLVYM